MLRKNWSLPASSLKDTLLLCLGLFTLLQKLYNLFVGWRFLEGTQLVSVWSVLECFGGLVTFLRRPFLDHSGSPGVGSHLTQSASNLSFPRLRRRCRAAEVTVRAARDGKAKRKEEQRKQLFGEEDGVYNQTSKNDMF